MNFRLSLVVLILCGLSVLLSSVGVNPWDVISKAGDPNLPPSSHFWLGTDFIGRDVFGKLIHGLKISFAVGLAAAMVAVPFGALLGAWAGYRGGWVDRVTVWLFSTFSCVPQILMLLAISFIMGKGLGAMCIAIAATSWIGTCRMTRAEAMKVRSLEFVSAAEALGATHFRVFATHILPNVVHVVIADVTYRFIYAIKSEAILSYLGIGMQSEPSWGLMIADAQETLAAGTWWEFASVTLAMFVVALALNAFGDELRDRWDPKTPRT